jgi:hypothetical protein
MTAVAGSGSLAPTRGWSKAQVSGLRLRSGQLRSELTNINLAESGAAVACHEQLRSDLANKATGHLHGQLHHMDEVQDELRGSMRRMLDGK